MDLWVRAGNKSHQKTALQGLQLSTNHDGVAYPREASQRYRSSYFFCSLIRGFGHPVGRHGEGGDWGNTATSKRSVNETPVWDAAGATGFWKVDRVAKEEGPRTFARSGALRDIPRL